MNSLGDMPENFWGYAYLDKTWTMLRKYYTRWSMLSLFLMSNLKTVLESKLL